MARVVLPLPACDFDPTEAGVSWQVLSDAGIEVAFATPTGEPAVADPVMVTGEGLDPWARLPGLRRVVAIGRLLRADRAGRTAHAAMVASPAFAHPIRWDDLDLAEVGGLVLAGGHAPGMRPYLESTVLQRTIVEAFRRDLPVGAICHGVLLVARSIDPDTGRSVLHGRRTTALTWPQERLAATIGRVVRSWDPGYYRTYADGPGQAAGHMSVQAEVTRALARPEDFVGSPGPGTPTRRDRPGDGRAAHVVVDGAYVSARWPGDTHTFAARVADAVHRADGCDRGVDVGPGPGHRPG